MPQTAYYFYRLARDEFVSEFCVANSCDPEQYVETMAPDGTRQRWAKRQDGDLLVFRPPDGYVGEQGLLWAYNKRLQIGLAMPREELERQAIRCKVSA